MDLMTPTSHPPKPNQLSLTEVLSRQSEHFHSAKTMSLKSRRDSLKALKACVKKYEQDVSKALHSDLRKSEFEAYGSEIGVFYQEVDYLLRHLKSWMKPRSVGTPLSLLPSRSEIRLRPFGKVLIFSPFNYPFQLLMVPLAGALAAGNTVVAKPSELTPHTSELIQKIISECFGPELAHVVLGGPEVSAELSKDPSFDLIFFTGSPSTGKKVALSAAENMTPTVMELGGKSPCVVTTTAAVKVTARRIVWGKFFNAGQTCIAPDYLLVPESLKEAYLTALKEQIRTLYGSSPQKSADYGRIVSARHLTRLKKLMESSSVYSGGTFDDADHFLEPTILHDVKWDDPVMKEEIFGPLLPVLTYSDLNEVVRKLQSLPSPLALYVFSSNESDFDTIAERVRFGGGAYNDTLVQYLSPKLPIGGMGLSGWGTYRGEHSFESFSHRQGVVFSTSKVDVPLRYPPYKKGTLSLLKRIMG